MTTKQDNQSIMNEGDLGVHFDSDSNTEERGQVLQ
jgi:hypothetical protein